MSNCERTVRSISISIDPNLIKYLEHTKDLAHVQHVHDPWELIWNILDVERYSMTVHKGEYNLQRIQSCLERIYKQAFARVHIF